MECLAQHHLKVAVAREVSPGQLASLCRAIDAYIRATYPAARPALSKRQREKLAQASAA